MNAVMVRIFGFTSASAVTVFLAGAGFCWAFTNTAGLRAAKMNSKKFLRKEKTERITISRNGARVRRYSLQDSCRTAAGCLLASLGSEKRPSRRDEWGKQKAASTRTMRSLNVGGDAGDFFADHQFVDVVGAFVSENAFEVVHVAHDAVVVDNAVGAEDVAGLAGNVQRDADVIHFQHGNVRRINFAGVFYASNMQGQQLALNDFGNHPCQFFLDQLVRSNRLVGKLFARFSVLQRGVIAGHGRAQSAPANSVARLIQAAQRTF